MLELVEIKRARQQKSVQMANGDQRLTARLKGAPSIAKGKGAKEFKRCSLSQKFTTLNFQAKFHFAVA
ncbi:MAG: hypothetical protein RMK89_09910 [Armatimonadota bacterium]|nr:hypothetical protein [Armatimonadota bacterium]MDW8143762.1 hypothetical protein [Armatimonadota bacterium]